MSMRRLPGLLMAAAALAGCTTPATRVVLLPQEGEAASAVVVRARGGEQVLSRPYQRATAPLDGRGAPVLDQVDPAVLRAENPALFQLAPAPVRRYTIYFDAGTTLLTAASQLALDQALAAALARPGGDIVVTGHTDTVGAGPQNDDLSLRRARQVRQMLIDRQFPAARIEAVGRGERELAVPTADDVGEPRNRRVAIEVR